MTATPLIYLVPKDPVENLRWRLKLRKAALHDRELQRALFDACMQDVLFWFNFACWVFEPRSIEKIKPFVTWCHQDPVIVQMDLAIDEAERLEMPIDVLLDKSRAQGGTYIYLNIFLRRWLRDPMFSAGLVTRNEKLVDSSTDADTLLWKVAWAIGRLPSWMLPKGFDITKHRSLSDHSILNPDLGSTFVGYAAGQDVGRGGRKTVFACDEIGAQDFIKGAKDQAVMDALHDVTNCIFLVSTFGADTGVFYDAASNPDSDGLHLILDWRDNPVQSKLSYVIREGVAVARNPDAQADVDRYVKENRDRLKMLARRGYKMEGQVRSPWYDARCLRKGATPRLIAKELDRNPRGAVGKVFDVVTLDRAKERSCKPPVWQGRLVYDAETLQAKGLIRQENGPLKLWFEPGIDNSPPIGPFVLGCDISAGGSGDYSSNSVVCGIDRRSGEQALEYAVMGMPVIKFGDLAVAVALWMHKAYLGWEDSGMAAPFAKQIMETRCYRNVYFREVDEIGSRAKSRKAGWWNGSDEDKAELFEGMCIAMEDGEFTPRSEDLIRECGEYEWDGGKIVHRPTKNVGAAGKAHGDRCVAGGVAVLLTKDRPGRQLDREEEIAHNPPYGSPAWRHMREEAERRKWTDDEPQFSIDDLLRLR